MLLHVYGPFPDHAHIRNVLCWFSTRVVDSVAVSHPDPCLSLSDVSIAQTFGYTSITRPFEGTEFDMANVGDICHPTTQPFSIMQSAKYNIYIGMRCWTVGMLDDIQWDLGH